MGCAGVALASASEGGLTPYPKGYRDFQSGILPGPGLQVRYDVIGYSGTENAVVNPGRLSLDVQTWTGILNVNFITHQRILGAHYAFGFRTAFTDVAVNRSLTTPLATISRQGDMVGLNDLALSPIILGWHAGNWHWNVSTTVWVPIGDYDSTRPVNTGRNYWTVAPQIAITYLDPIAGWELSGAASYLFNFENPATRYDSGDVLHIDFAWGRQIVPWLKLGLVGYLMRQTTSDSGRGAVLGDRQGRVFGLGPAAAFTVPFGSTPVTLVAKYYREFDASDTLQGDTLAFSTRVKF